MEAAGLWRLSWPDRAQCAFLRRRLLFCHQGHPEDGRVWGGPQACAKLCGGAERAGDADCGRLIIFWLGELQQWFGRRQLDRPGGRTEGGGEPGRQGRQKV